MLTTPGAFDTVFNGFYNAVFVTKLNPSGTALIYSTYLGGLLIEERPAIAVDAAGSAYVAGGTGGLGFPTTPGAFQTVYHGGESGYVTKFDPTGTTLIYSTFLGGSKPSLATGIAVDQAGNAYVTGLTDSPDFPTTAGSFQTALSGGDSTDAFIAKLNPSGTALVYSTYLGGTAVDVGVSIAIDCFGNASVAGTTASTDFPTTAHAFQTVYGGGEFDAFTTMLNAAGSRLLYSTYLGGDNWDSGNQIAVDSAGNAYVTGETQSMNFPTRGAFQSTFGGGKNDAFVAKIARSRKHPPH